MIVLKCPRGVKCVGPVAFRPGTGELFAPAGSGVLCWPTPAQGGVATLRPAVGYVSHVVFSPDGSRLFAGHDGVCAIDPDDPADPGESVPVVRWGVIRCAVSPDGGRLLLAEPQRGRAGGSRLICHPAAGPYTPLWERTTTTLFHTGVFFLPDGERVVAVESDLGGRVVVRAAADGRELDNFGYTYRSPDFVAPSPDGERLAVVRGTELDVHPLRPAARSAAAKPTVLRNDNRKHFTAAAWHPSGKYLAVVSNDGTVKLCDANTWAVVRAFAWDAGQLSSVAFSPDGALAAAGTRTGKVVVWDVDG